MPMLTPTDSNNAVRPLEEQLRLRADELARLNARLQQEIVAHSQTEQRLRASQRSLAESQRLAHIGSWEFDLATQQAVWSEEMYRLYGCRSDTFTPNLKNMLACVPPEDHAVVGAVIEKAQHTLHPEPFTHRVIHPNGAVRLLEGVCGAVREPDGTCRRIVGIARDVTADHEHEAALEQTVRELRQFKEIVNRSPAVVAIWHDAPGKTVEFVSENVARFGHRPDDILSGRIRLRDLIHPDDRMRVAAEYAAHTAAAHASFPMSYRLLTAAGECRWIHEEITTLPSNGSKRFQTVMLDVTAEREAEHRFQDITALNQAIIAAAPVGIAACTSSGQCVFANPAMSHIIDIPLGQILTQNINHLASWRQSGLLALAQKALATGIGQSDVIRVTTSSGRDVWLDSSFTPVQRGDKPLLLVTFHDITERHRAEERLDQSEKRFRQLFESMSEGCTLYDLVYDQTGAPMDAQVTAINPAGEAIIGMRAEEMIGRRASAMVPINKPLFLNLYAALDQGGPPVTIETRLDFLKKDLFLSFSSPRKGAIAAIYKDITPRKQAEAKLLQYQQQLRHLAAEIAMAGEQERRRIAVELHDGLGQALVLCKMKLEALTLEAKNAPLLRQLQGSVRLVEEAISVTRSLTFQLSPPVLHEIGLGAAIDWLAEHMGEQHGLDIRITRQSMDEPAAMAVRVILFQAVRELVLNAVKHARAAMIAIDIRTQRGHLEIEVRDNGAGFDAGTQHGSTRSGMGLFNIQERMQLIGGVMTIESRPDTGTRVTLIAPLESLPAEDRKGTPHEHSNSAV